MILCKTALAQTQLYPLILLCFFHSTEHHLPYVYVLPKRAHHLPYVFIVYYLYSPSAQKKCLLSEHRSEKIYKLNIG